MSNPSHRKTSARGTPSPAVGTHPGDRQDDLAWPRQRDWAGVFRRRWPVLALLLLIVAAGAWIVSRRGSGQPEARPDAATTGATASDSVVTLDSTAQRLAGIELLTITSNTGRTLVANGTITYDANRVSVASSRVDGRIVSVRADLGQQVRAGGLLAVLESSEVGQIRGDLERARANVEIARKNYEREKRLFEEQISPQKEMLEAESAYRTAEADLRSAEARLRAIGATEGQGARFGLVSSVTGTVVERNASPGQTVGPSASLFTVADLSHVWITVDVYEVDLSRVRQGATATVTPTALPNETFLGRVTYAGGVVDTLSRTFKVRVELSNTAQRLRPGMFAQVRIEATGSDAAGVSLVVPEVAVQEVNGKQVVFVSRGAPGRYVVRHVTIGPRAGGGMLIVTSGLAAGEQVVTRGAFQLKAELTKASFGESE